PEFSHIRYAARFTFPVFFIANILLAGALQMFVNKSSYKWLNLLLITIVCLLLTSDSYDSIRTFYAKRNPFKKENFENEISIPKIDYADYQAILPLPYYHVGSADWHHTMETDESFFSRTLYISANTHLPLMSCKMSRTPDYQNRDLVNLFLKDEVSPKILNRLNNKPVLLVLDKNNCTNQGVAAIADHSFAFQASANCQNFIARVKPTLLHEDDRYAYYSWNIKP
ncbi:MAG TPA: hypothetical protein VK174_11245, partial [Chitinophagales bacterium]|nr:hypothetical protein [Chitinophagales bacterium]